MDEGEGKGVERGVRVRRLGGGVDGGGRERG